MLAIPGQLHESADVLDDLARSLRRHIPDELLVLNAAVEELRLLVKLCGLPPGHGPAALAQQVITTGTANPEELEALADFVRSLSRTSMRVSAEILGQASHH